MTDQYDAIVLGAGGAGLMCAGVAGQRGRRVLVVDHADAPGKKILISGGGRCNFTNLGAAPDRFLSANPHFAKSALGRYTPADFLALVEAYGIAWHEKTLGQLFCDGSARQIVAMLLAECDKGGVELRLDSPLGEIGHADGRFTVPHGTRVASAPALVIATGGPSIPKLGATDASYRLARRFGLKVVEPRPALVPFTLPPAEALFRELAGVAVPTLARAAQGPAFPEATLFTHRGLSGPAMLQVSSYWRHGEPVAIDLLPDRAPGWLVAAKRARPRATLAAVLGEALPDRLAKALAEKLGEPALLPAEGGAGSGSARGENTARRVPTHPRPLPSREGRSGLRTLADTRDTMLAEAERRLAAWTFNPNGTEGFAKAEVTVGGVATDGLSSKTMAARAVPGLHVIGEAVDVTGWLGGYNFQWAWASGWAAAQAL